MRRILFVFVNTTILIFITAASCFLGAQSVARTNSDEPKKLVPPPIIYEDSTKPQVREAIHKLDSFYAIQRRAGFNGSVLVGYKGKIIYERYYGVANREMGVPLSPQTASQLASVSKTFTGAAILYLHQHKYLNIDEKVSTYLKQFPYPQVTVKMLLCHRAGLPDYTKWIPRYRKDTRTPITNHDVLEMFARYKPALEFKPNTHFKYSNSNYAILASIIEEVTELNFKDFMQKYVFTPLGMKNTYLYDPVKGPPAYKSTISYKYNWRREPDMFADGVYGDKGVYSTVQDMYKWDQSFYQNVLLSNETLEMAYGPCSFEKPGVKNYGLGWRMLCFPNGDKIIYHNGWWHGNNTVFYRFIKDNFTIIILGNKYNNNIYRQAPIVYGLARNKPISAHFDTED